MRKTLTMILAILCLSSMLAGCTTEGTVVEVIEDTETTSAVQNENESSDTLNADTEIMEEEEIVSGEYFLDACEPYASANIRLTEEGETVKMANNDYGHAFVFEPTVNTARKSCFANFNLEKKYTTIKFAVGHVDGSSLDDSMTLQINCDGELAQEITLTSADLPKEVVLDVTDVERLEFVTELRMSYYAVADIIAE